MELSQSVGHPTRAGMSAMYAICTLTLGLSQTACLLVLWACFSSKQGRGQWQSVMSNWPWKNAEQRTHNPQEDMGISVFLHYYNGTIVLGPCYTLHFVLLKSLSELVLVRVYSCHMLKLVICLGVAESGEGRHLWSYCLCFRKEAPVQRNPIWPPTLSSLATSQCGEEQQRGPSSGSQRAPHGRGSGSWLPQTHCWHPFPSQREILET